MLDTFYGASLGVIFGVFIIGFDFQKIGCGTASCTAFAGILFLMLIAILMDMADQSHYDTNRWLIRAFVIILLILGVLIIEMKWVNEIDCVRKICFRSLAILTLIRYIAVEAFRQVTH